MKTVSIITINYNNRAGLELTLKSVIAQTCSDYELIVIDGGSSDGSSELLAHYSDSIAYSVSEKDKGVYNAQNKGIRAAKGKFCLFLNSGDSLAADNVLGQVLQCGMDADIVYGNMLIDEGNKVTEGFMPDVPGFEHMIRDTLWHPVSFIKRELFTRFGEYREDLRIVADYDFFLKTVIVNKVKTKHIPVFVSVFRTDGMSSRPENTALILAEREKVQRAYFTKKQIDSVYDQSILSRINKKIRRWFQ